MRRERNNSIKIGFDRSVVMLGDIVVINFCLAAALLLRFDLRMSQVPILYINNMLIFASVYSFTAVVIYYLARMYHYIWSHISFRELPKIVAAELIVLLLNVVLSLFLDYRLPLAVYFIGGCFILFFDTSMRYSYRFWIQSITMLNHHMGKTQTKTMVVGAGEAGRIIIKELLDSEHLKVKVCCAIDDNPLKFGNYLEGVKIVGDCDTIPENVKKYGIEQIIVAIPSASAKRKKEIYDICKGLRCTLKTVPGIYQLVNGELNKNNLRPVNLEDLLGREPVRVNNDDILRGLKGKSVLVTGGGGSIGSEICRQIAAKRPANLIIFDIYENNAYDIQQELNRKYPNLPLEVLIGSVRDEARLDYLFKTYRPDIVFHAAAHKHVPLMEDSPLEAIKNNVFGTLITARAAMRYNADRFVLISTDKAVNPTSIMGASKRICEMIVQTLDKKSDTTFAAVRFGNVLGSNGSVVPLFEKQIRDGGPVTVTHPDVVRYFMTIPEAVSLVLQTMAYAKGGEIFVLDMGAPVKICDLARNLIQLSGYIPGEDIKIVYTGLRPGEKLYEEMLMEEEGLQCTENESIHIGKRLDINEMQFFQELKKLEKACHAELSDIGELVANIVPTYSYEKHREPVFIPAGKPHRHITVAAALDRERVI